MQRILVGENEHRTSDLDEFWTKYFSLLRLKVDARGLLNGKEIFAIKKGRERNAYQRRIFSTRPDVWRAPSKEQIHGALQQFSNLSALARLMGVARSSVSKWQDTGVISFHSWRYLCEYLGIHRKVSLHNLEYIGADWIND